jgi:hypothetical protein
MAIDLCFVQTAELLECYRSGNALVHDKLVEWTGLKHAPRVFAALDKVPSSTIDRTLTILMREEFTCVEVLNQRDTATTIINELTKAKVDFAPLDDAILRSLVSFWQRLGILRSTVDALRSSGD